MERTTSGSQPLIVGADEFMVRLSDEIIRSDRYEHPFTILTLEPPEGAPDFGDLTSRWLDSSASGLTRGCDVVALLDGGPTLIILLPETDVSGAGSVLGRLRSVIAAEAEQEWTFGLFEYPQNKEKLQQLMERAA
jgi:hypothetical protein